jgi:restriction endonuclease Mrr
MKSNKIGADEGVFIITSNYTNKAKNFVENLHDKYEMKLIDGKETIEMLYETQEIVKKRGSRHPPEFDS